ncbi:hypothetical protein L484_015533 [Morus notabilis]|uniref:Uncharacterized protein n=1 Tax=Morus notabilis TaxID=981085 RepID=W9RIW0_9ROSA|nr:hypothetical protein L484_015533 [Morus notabilis]
MHSTPSPSSRSSTRSARSHRQREIYEKETEAAVIGGDLTRSIDGASTRKERGERKLIFPHYEPRDPPEKTSCSSEDLTSDLLQREADERERERESQR